LLYFTFPHTPTTSISTLSLHDALPIWYRDSTSSFGDNVVVGADEEVVVVVDVGLDVVEEAGVLEVEVGGAAFDEPHATTAATRIDRKSTRLNSSHLGISYAVFCLKKKK